MDMQNYFYKIFKHLTYLLVIISLSKLIAFAGFETSSIINLKPFRHATNNLLFKFEKEVEEIKFETILSIKTTAKIIYEDIIDSIQMPDNIWKGKQTIVYKFRKPTKTFKIISDTSFTNRKILFTLEELLVKYKDGSIEDMSVDDKKFEKIAKGFSYIERYKDKDFTLENLTNAWDSRWYKDIALNGYKYNGNYYELQNPVFAPLYPLISNFFNTFIRNIDLSLLLVNNLFSTIAIFIFYITFLKFYNFEIAFKTIILMLFYPGALFFTVAYSEGLALFLISLSFYFLMRKKYFLSYLFIGISTAVRIQCIFFSVAFLIIYLMESRSNLNTFKLLFYSMVSLIGIIGYSIYLYIALREPLAWFNLSRYAWSENLPFFETLLESFGQFKYSLSRNPFLPPYSYAFLIVLFSIAIISHIKRNGFDRLSLIAFITIYNI